MSNNDATGSYLRNVILNVRLGKTYVKSMGGSVRKFVNPRAYYNIERRALKKIEKEKDKPTAAPKHKKYEQLDVYCE